MNVLAIDCTGKDLTVAVKNDGKWFYFSGMQTGVHSVNLNYAIEKTLADAGLDYGGVGAYCCNVGPGSFTGIRVSIATIKGLNFSAGKKLVSVNTFELAAYNDEEPVAVLIPDNKGYFRAGVHGGVLITVPEHIASADRNPDALKEIVCESGGAEALAAVCDRKISKGVFCGDFEPLYIRKSQAEELHGGR